MGPVLMPADEERVFTAIGRLEEQLSNLSEKFERLEETSAGEHRKVHDIVVAMSESVRNLVRDIAEMKPLTDDYREKRAEARGAARLAGWLYTAAGVVGGGVVFIAGKLVDWFSTRPHIPVIAIIVLALLAITTAALAQHNHAQHHASYQSWTSHAGVNCCNDRDCGELPDADERANGGRLEVFIDGQWCPILPQHYLKSGNVPNASVSHVCIVKATPSEIRRGCQRLLCYQPKPGS